MTTKRCFKCLCEKPIEVFYKHAKMADGHLNKCKDCAKTDVLLHRQQNLEKVRAYDKLRSSQPHRIELRARVNAEYIAKFPERKKANTAVGTALRYGILKKQPCSVCGAVKAVAHHPDYDYPLDVVWLCQPHHKQVHAYPANPKPAQRGLFLG